VFVFEGSKVDVDGTMSVGLEVHEAHEEVVTSGDVVVVIAVIVNVARAKRVVREFLLEDIFIIKEQNLRRCFSRQVL
jgi:hypothetical protein